MTEGLYKMIIYFDISDKVLKKILKELCLLSEGKRISNGFIISKVNLNLNNVSERDETLYLV